MNEFIQKKKKSQILFGKLNEKNDTVLDNIFTMERRQVSLNVIFSSFDAK